MEPTLNYHAPVPSGLADLLSQLHLALPSLGLTRLKAIQSNGRSTWSKLRTGLLVTACGALLPFDTLANAISGGVCALWMQFGLFVFFLLFHLCFASSGLCFPTCSERGCLLECRVCLWFFLDCQIYMFEVNFNLVNCSVLMLRGTELKTYSTCSGVRQTQTDSHAFLTAVLKERIEQEWESCAQKCSEYVIQCYFMIFLLAWLTLASLSFPRPPTTSDDFPPLPSWMADLFCFWSFVCVCARKEHTACLIN